MKIRNTLYGTIVLLLSGLVLVFNTNALTFQDEDTDIYFSINPSIGLTISDDNLSITGLLPGNSAKSSNVTLTVTSNSSYGYKLLASVGNGTTYTSNNLINGTANFTSLATDASLALTSITPGAWGYDKNDNNTFSGLPYFSDGATEILTRSNAGGGTVALAIGAKASNTQPSGNYENVINFSLVGGVPPVPSMQTVTDEYLASAIPNEWDSITLVDARDNREYSIVNMGGYYVMEDDLKITGTVTAALSNFAGADFNISAGSILSGLTYTQPRTASFYDYDSSGNTYIEEHCSNYYDCDSIGTYYNYCAATAGTVCSDAVSVDATQDICPAGWRLPGEDAVTIITHVASYGWSSHDKWDVLVHGFLGYRDDESDTIELVDYGNEGFFWSSSVASWSDDSYAGVMHEHADAAWYGMDLRKDFGATIRCVKAYNEKDVLYEEDIEFVDQGNGSVVATMPEDNGRITVDASNDNKSFSAQVVNGVATIVFSGLSSGNHYFRVSAYEGNNYIIIPGRSYSGYVRIP